MKYAVRDADIEKIIAVTETYEEAEEFIDSLEYTDSLDIIYFTVEDLLS